MRQVAALPYRADRDGELQILLITSRETRRWVLPKGNLMAGLMDYEAAAREAFEEAGVQGSVGTIPIGRYAYRKRLRQGVERKAKVSIYPLAVTNELDEWPEQFARTRAWFSTVDAAKLVVEDDLGSVIASLTIRSIGEPIKSEHGRYPMPGLQTEPVSI